MFADVKDGNLVGRRDVVARFEDDRAATAFHAELMSDALIVAAEGIAPAHEERLYQADLARRYRRGVSDKRLDDLC